MATNKISRREFLRLSALAGGAAALAACGGSSGAPVDQGAAATAAPIAAPTAAEAAPTAVPAEAAPTAVPAEAAPTAAQAAASADQLKLDVLAENWGDIYNNLMTVIGDDYTKANPGTKIDWTFDPDWQTKLTTLLAANTPPDVTFMRPAQLAALAPKGALMEFDELLKQSGHKRDDFVTSLYDSSVYDGKLYALPGGADYWCLFYSKDVYKDAGLDPEKPPTTFDELIEHSKQILQKDSSGDIQRIGYVPGNGQQFQNWCFIFGGSFYDSNSNKITASNPANVELLSKLQDYVKLLDINKLNAFNQRPGTYEAGNPFATKQSAYLLEGFWTYEALDQHSPDINYAITFWPTLKGTEEERKNYMSGGWMYSLPKDSKHADEGWKFLQYAFIDNSAKMGYQTLNGPCVKSQFPEFIDGLKQKMGAGNRMAPYVHFFTDTGAVATNYFPVIPVQSYYQDELNRVYDLALRGEMTPQAALDEVTKNVQAELDKAMKKS